MHSRSFKEIRLKLTPRKIRGTRGVYARYCPYSLRVQHIAGPGINPRHVDALLVKNYRAVLL